MPDDQAKLVRTLESFNVACNTIAAVAVEHDTANKIERHMLIDRDIRRQFDVSSQMTVCAMAKVAEAYKRDLEGNLGRGLARVAGESRSKC